MNHNDDENDSSIEAVSNPTDNAPSSSSSSSDRLFLNPSDEMIEEASKLGVDLKDKRIQKVMAKIMKERKDEDPKRLITLCIHKGTVLV